MINSGALLRNVLEGRATKHPVLKNFIRSWEDYKGRNNLPLGMGPPYDTWHDLLTEEVCLVARMTMEEE